jgi:ATP-dependent RNA helicase HelY
VVGSLPTVNSRKAYGNITRQYERIRRRERRSMLELTRATETGFADIAYRWCRGADLEEILADEDLTAGDFIRNCKQTIDLLRQLREAAELHRRAEHQGAEEPGLREALGKAVDGLNRGVVAYAGAV